jgi:hypothetical protein
MTAIPYNATAADVWPGDFIDAEGIPYYSDEDRALGEFDFFEVTDVERETPDCVVIYCDNGSAGMPPSTPVYRITLAELRAENAREEN